MKATLTSVLAVIVIVIAFAGVIRDELEHRARMRRHEAAIRRLRIAIAELEREQGTGEE